LLVQTQHFLIPVGYSKRPF